MKKYLTIILIFILCCCGQNKKTEMENINNVVTVNIDTLSTELIINSFKEFRESIYQGNITKVKTFINFPIINENNEIWYLAYSGNDKALEKLSEKTLPFPEKEFDKNFENIFPNTFIKSILKIKSEILFDRGEFETIVQKEGKTEYKTFANYNKKEKTLILNVLYETLIIINDGEDDFTEKSEQSIIYYFDITVDNKIKFKQIRMAG